MGSNTLTDAPQTPAVASDRPYLTLSMAAWRAGVSRGTLVNWRKVGIRRTDGVRVWLRSERRGGRWMFTQSWIDEFFRALSDVPDPAGPPRAAPEYA
jgi:hypothetical protein